MPSVTIPLRPAAAESLNVAAAAAIACEHVAQPHPGRIPCRQTKCGPAPKRYRRAPCRRLSPMLERIEEIRGEAGAAIEAAAGTAELEELRVRYLGRKAELTGDPARHRRAARRGTGQGRRRRQPGAPSARSATRVARRAARRGRAGGPARSPTGSTSPCPAPRPCRSATST